MRGCYKDELERPPPPSRVALTTMTVEREELYRYVPPPGDPIPVRDLPFLVDYGIPEDEDIAWELHRLHLNRSAFLQECERNTSASG